MDATCETCPFYGGRRDKLDGTCHRNPPVFMPNVPYGADGEAEGVFPYVYPTGYCGEHPLLQRDRLAAMAMQGLIVDPDGFQGFGGFDPDADRSISYGERVSRAAYAIADAMLAERNKK